MSELFRQQAVEHATAPRMGGVMLAPPAGRTVYVVALLAMLAVATTFMAFGTYTRRVTVSGEITTSSGYVYIHSDKPAAITGVLVRQGQHVRKGQALVRLSSNQATLDGSNLHEDMARQMSHQRRLLEQQIGVGQRSTDLKRGEILNQIALLKQMRTRVRQQQALVAARIGLLDDRTAKYQRLLDGRYVAQSDVDSVRSERLAADMQLKTLQVQQDDLDQKIQGARSSLASLPLEALQRKSELDAQIAQVRQSEIQAAAEGAWVAVSPMDGIVSSVPVKAGQEVGAQQVLVTVIPPDAVMEANLRVPDAASGLVEPGQRVLLRLTSFPYQKYGQLPGRIGTVDRAPVALAAPPGDGTSGASTVYRAVAALDAQQVRANGRAYPLLPGMTFEADLMLERRRFIEWVIAPVVGFTRRNLSTGGTPNE
jgi:membrane fusion protein